MNGRPRPPPPRSNASFSQSSVSEWSTLPPSSRRGRGRGRGGSGKRSDSNKTESNGYDSSGSVSTDRGGGQIAKRFKTPNGGNVLAPLFERGRNRGRGRLGRIQEVQEEDSGPSGGVGLVLGVGGGEGEYEEEEEDLIKDKRVLSFHAPAQGSIAGAWYDPEERKIQVLEDTKDTVSWDLAWLMMEQVHPQLIIMSSKTVNSLVRQVETYKSENNACELLLLPFKSCTARSAALNLASIRLPDRSSPFQPVASSPADDDDSGAIPNEEGVNDNDAGMGQVRLSLVKLGCWVNLAAPLAVIATGILVDQVKRSLIPNNATGPQWRPILELTALESMELDRRMQINQDALTSLAIFDTEAHAFMHKATKPALSIFGLLDTTVTPLGRKLFHSWHLRPLVDLHEIRARHDAIDLLTAPQNISVTESIRRELRNVRNVPAKCTKVRNGNGGYREWKCLIDALSAAIEIKNMVTGLQGPLVVPIIDKIDQTFEGGLRAFTVKMNEFNQVAGIICKQIPYGLTRSVNVVYFPQLGYLAVVQADSDEPPIIPRWQHKFRTGDKFYYKTEEMINLDEHFGDLHVLIVERQIEIVQVLVAHLQEVEFDLLATIDVVAELDCAVKTYSLTRPTIIEEPDLVIEGGRHLLYEKSVQRYITNDIGLSAGTEGEYNSMLVVTGANGSGKSAYGKQTALIAFMAQIGSFVPADRATIGVCDKNSRILFETRLGIHDRSRTGTCATDGAGLLAGVIEHLLKGPCPRTIVLTHFHDLFTKQFLSDDLFINFCHMKTFLVQDSNEMHYLYKVVPTMSTSSYAAECALRHGVPEEIVERARYVTDCVSKFQVAKLHDSRMTDEQKRDMDAAEALARRFLTWVIDPEIEDVKEKLMDMLEETEPKYDVKAEVQMVDEMPHDDQFGDGESVEPSEEGM
ncbi:hypothetical protein IAR55_006680 [Kwoniella newhampshirensis]|uniref:DNA mismatch repair proteins mutS family domain-containing protein n=1 Tax=Kwoniella newhampshirensis TaxID=1651941 RepID=A0AAW0YI33_9TREE